MDDAAQTVFHITGRLRVRAEPTDDQCVVNEQVVVANLLTTSGVEVTQTSAAASGSQGRLPGTRVGSAGNGRQQAAAISTASQANDPANDRSACNIVSWALTDVKGRTRGASGPKVVRHTSSPESAR